MFGSREDILNEMSKNANENQLSMIDILKRGDAKQGEALANNLLKTYGISKEQALQMARKRINPEILKMFGF